jgi:hypothetical protein
MTDRELANRTYIEPLAAGFVAAIIRRERPMRCCRQLRGPTALNIANLSEKGILNSRAEAVKIAGIDYCLSQAMWPRPDMLSRAIYKLGLSSLLMDAFKPPEHPRYYAFLLPPKALSFGHQCQEKRLSRFIGQ